MSAYRVLLPLTLPWLLMASDGEKQLNKATALLSANLLLKQLEKEFSETPPNSDFMFEQMSTTPADYVKPNEAAAKLEELYLDRLRTDYRQRVHVMLSRIAEKTAADGAFDESFRKTASTLPDETLKAARERHFAASFAEQRKRACSNQFEQVTRNIFPTEEEVDAQPEEALVKTLTQRLAGLQSFAVFEENRLVMQDLVVAPVVQDAFRQRKLQQHFLEQFRSPHAATPGEFHALLEKELSAALPQFRAEKYPKVYAVFPSVKRDLPTLSDKKAKERYLDFLQSTTLPYPEEEIKRMLKTDLSAHKTRKASREKLRDAFIKQGMEQAPQRYLQHVSPERQPGVADYLKGNPLSEAELRQLFEAFFDQKQHPAWEAARASLSAEQTGESYTSLLARTWTPPAAVTEQYTGLEATQEGRELRSDLLKQCAASKQAHDAALEETLSQAGALLDQELGRASHALRCQRRLVLASSNDIATEAAVRLAAKSKPERIANDLVGLFLPKISSAWLDLRDKELYNALNPKPGNAGTAYRELFPSVEALLRQLIRDILQKLAEPQPTPPPQEPPPDTPPPEEKPEVLKLACAFTLDISGENITVRSKGDIVTEEATLPMAYNDYRKLESKTLTRIADQFAEQLAEKAKGHPVELTLDIYVKNGMIYYQLISRLRDRLDYRLKKLNNEKLSIKLTDKMD